MKDREPFERVAARCERAIWAYLAGAVGDDEAARDLTQETFLRAWRGYDRFRGDSDPFTWVWAIARNVLRRHQRREKVRRLFLVRYEREKRAAPDRRGKEWERIRLREEIAKLHEPFRETLILHYFAGRSVREIAAGLGIAVGTVKSRLARAREMLAKGLVNK